MRTFLRIFGAAVILLAISGNACAQKFDTLWTQVYWNGFFDSANCVQQTADGGFIITGVTRAAGQIDTDLNLIKTDSAGGVEWAKIFGDTVNQCGFHVLQTSDGGYLVSSQTNSPFDVGLGKVTIYKFDADGDSLWTYMHQAADPQINGRPLYAIETNDGGYAVTGVININYDNKAFILRLNAAGGFLDMDTVSEYSYQDGVYITQMPDSGFMVVGNFRDPYTTDYDFWAFRTNRFGDVYWDSLYVITDYTDLVYGACRVDDGIVMVGVARGASHAVKIDFDGHTVWSKSISIYFTGEEVHSICPAPDGGFMVGGMIWVTYHRRDFTFSRLDSEGELLWYYTVGGTEDDNGQWIVPTDDGGFVMTGSSASFVNGECHYLVKARSYFCGDANGDDAIDVSDAVYLVNYIFRDGPEPIFGYCHGDANDDGGTDVSDIVMLINYIFRDGPSPFDTCCE
jgi:hypothetical protein